MFRIGGFSGKIFGAILGPLEGLAGSGFLEGLEKWGWRNGAGADERQSY